MSLTTRHPSSVIRRPLRLIFMGTPAFALPALKALHQAGHYIVAVYTQPPRPAHRGQKETKSPVHLYAEAHGLPVYTPASLKSSEVQAEFAAHEADAAIVAAYGLLLPKSILTACPMGCINIHPSLLPRWRGAAPIQRTLMAGDAETGVCIMQMDEGLDTGGIILCEKLDATENIRDSTVNAQVLHDLLAHEAAPLLLKALEGLANGTLTAKPQPTDGVTYAQKITKEECRIDWSQDSETILNRIRGLSPKPGAYCLLNHEPLKILMAEQIPFNLASYGGTASPGVTVDNHLVVACGSGYIKLEQIQRPGKKPMMAEEFLNGSPVPAGTRLE